MTLQRLLERLSPYIRCCFPHQDGSTLPRIAVGPQPTRPRHVSRKNRELIIAENMIAIDFWHLFFLKLYRECRSHQKHYTEQKLAMSFHEDNDACSLTLPQDTKALEGDISDLVSKKE